MRRQLRGRGTELFQCAGNVSVHVVAKELRIVGDAGANDISIQQRKIDGVLSYVVKGLPAAGIGGIFSTLAVASEDEPGSEYGLVA